MRAKATAGFTLIELLIVMVLFGIVISLVTVSVTPDPRQQLGTEAARIGQLFTIAADEMRIKQQPIVWEADLQGYRFVTEAGGERQLITNDDLLRERHWDKPLTRLAVIEAGNTQPSQALLGPGAAAIRVPIAREWIQPRWRLEINNEFAGITIDFDEKGQGSVAVQNPGP